LHHHESDLKYAREVAEAETKGDDEWRTQRRDEEDKNYAAALRFMAESRDEALAKSLNQAQESVALARAEAKQEQADGDKQAALLVAREERLKREGEAKEQAEGDKRCGSSWVVVVVVVGRMHF
jgi:hypothetical protein